MGGTKLGGLRASQTNKARYGEDFYVVIGEKGGKKGRTGGFWYAKHVLGDTEFIRKAGAKGGRNSKRGPKE